MKPTRLAVLSVLSMVGARLQAQSPEGISVPAVIVRSGSGTWFGHYCPQPYGWSPPFPSGTVNSNATATVRVEALGSGFMVVAISFAWGMSSNLLGITGPLLLHPSAFAVIEVAGAGPLSSLGLGCYPGWGYEFTRSVPLPPGVRFAIQALVPDVGGGSMIFSAVTVVHVN